MKLVITKNGGALVDMHDNSLVSIDGESCTIVMSEMADSIEQRHQELSFATDIIEKIKHIQALLADSSGDTRVEPPTLKDSDVIAISDSQKQAVPFVGAIYIDDNERTYRYKGDGVFMTEDGHDLFLTEDAFRYLTLAYKP